MKKEVIKNRRNVIGKMEDNSVMIIFSGNEMKRSADGAFPFTVNRNFYHLTNINEPSQILVMKADGTETLYIEPVDEMYKKWIGRKLRKNEAIEISGIKDVRYINEFDFDILKNQELYLDLEEDTISKTKTPAEFMIDRFNINKSKIKDAYPLIAHSRSIKSERELEDIRKAIDITNRAILNMLDHFKPNVKESYYESYFDLILKQENVIHAFETIAAAGERATTLHYVTNDEIAKDGELVLFDLGATFNLMCADISRTFPTNGRFTEEQAHYYNMVLTAQQLVIEAIKPGVTMNELNDIVVDHYFEELKKEGLVQERDDVMKYYYHGVSHSLGLDVHDVGLDRDDKLVAGNVITVEPGIYIKEKGIGIRIEDDILVTEDGYENLSKDIIKSIEDIEEYMNEEKN